MAGNIDANGLLSSPRGMPSPRVMATSQAEMPARMRDAYVSAVSYMILSASLTFTNRYLLHDMDPAFKFPALLISIQAVFVGSLTSVGLLTAWKTECEDSVYWPSRISKNAAMRILVTTFLFGGDILLTQFALSKAPVSFVEVVKCLTPVIVMIQTWAMGIAKPQWRQCVVVLAICIGVVLATHSSGGVSFDLEAGGATLTVLAALIAGARVAFIQVVLQGELQCPKPLLLLYVAPALFVTGIVAFLLFELDQFTSWPAALEPDNIIRSLAWVCLSSLLAFGLNFTEIWCVSASSALLLTLAGSLKTVLMVAIASFATGRLLSLQAMVGSLIAIGGVALMKIVGIGSQEYSQSTSSPSHGEISGVSLTQQVPVD